MSAKFVKPKKAEEVFGVHRRTLKRWAEEGLIKFLRPGGTGQTLYDVSTATNESHKATLTDTAVEQPDRTDAIYARVSTRKQAPDLERQLATLRLAHPNATVFSDVASGLNFKRKGLRDLLKLVFQGRVRHVHVAHKDRLCRFAFDLIEYVFAQHGATITVDAESATSDEQELAQDVLSVITVFGARLHGKRSGQGRKRRREEEEEASKAIAANDSGEREENGNSSSSSADDEASRAMV
jgi:predicted site-specific integrase-resolvase